MSSSRPGLRVFGPSKEAAQLEASKAFAKQLMRHADVPTAEFRVFDHPDPARHYVETREYPVVVKADGLAAGKGVIVCSTTEEALAAIDRIMVREEFGRPAGRRVVIEKRLEGEELSVLALVSGRTIVALQPTQDHKAAFDDDEGPNTGGMGAYCPAPLGTPELMAQVEETILVPTVHAMKRGRHAFRGVLYAGLMLTNQGPRVLEFNCRFGDPETQPLLLRLRTDLLDLLEAAVDDRLDEFPEAKLEWDTRPAVCVVMASDGYPGTFQKGKVITGLAEAARLPRREGLPRRHPPREGVGPDRRRPRAGGDRAGRHTGRRPAAMPTRRWRRSISRGPTTGVTSVPAPCVPLGPSATGER